MSRHYTTSAIAAMPIDERCFRLAVAVGHVVVTGPDGEPLPWWFPFVDPPIQLWRHWWTLDPYVPWHNVYARYIAAPALGEVDALDDAYGRCNLSRDLMLTRPEAVTHLLDCIDGSNWQPAGS